MNVVLWRVAPNALQHQNVNELIFIEAQHRVYQTRDVEFWLGQMQRRHFHPLSLTHRQVYSHPECELVCMEFLNCFLWYDAARNGVREVKSQSS